MHTGNDSQWGFIFILFIYLFISFIYLFIKISINFYSFIYFFIYLFKLCMGVCYWGVGRNRLFQAVVPGTVWFFCFAFCFVVSLFSFFLCLFFLYFVSSRV